uniref:Uncharacterized protein n=1 Tax=Sinocyclocheilus rhinocerous TaxID=307959 RepID=A0A673M599_9TELE
MLLTYYCNPKLEEAKLKAKYPLLGNKPGGSDLLRKRLQKGEIQITGLWWFHTGSRTSQHHVKSHEPQMALALRDNRHKFWSV